MLRATVKEGAKKGSARPLATSVHFTPTGEGASLRGLPAPGSCSLGGAPDGPVMDSVSRVISQDGEEALASLAEQAVCGSAQRQPGRPLWLLGAHQGQEFSH